MKALFLRIKETDPEAFKAYLELISNKTLSKECNLDLTATTLAKAFVWSAANKTEFFWEQLARKLGERETPIFKDPCLKYRKEYQHYD